MPEAEYPQAISKLGSEIKSKFPKSEEITGDVLKKKFPHHSFVFGWKIYNAIDQDPYDLLVTVDFDFPWTLPHIILPSPPENIRLPHVESDGKLCLVPSQIAYQLPVEATHLETLIEYAREVLQQGRSKENETDFYIEAESYWKPSKLSEIWVTQQLPETHSIQNCVIVGRNFILGSDLPSLRKWTEVSGRKVGSTQVGLVVRLPTPLHPEWYPRTMKDLFKLIESIGASTKLNQAISQWNRKHSLPIVLVFEYDGRDVMLGCQLTPPEKIIMPNKEKKGIPGFRINTKTTSQVLISSLSQVSHELPRMKVVPTFRDYLHTRTLGSKMGSFNSKHVIIAGCGALGGHLAVQLAQMGIGRLTLLDNDTFDWANVGRHVLDGSDVGQFKAIALQHNIHRRFPEMDVVGVPKKWERFRSESEDLFNSADLIISVTGDAASNIHLDTLVEEKDAPPVIFGWIEAFGIAAHAIFRCPHSGKLTDICDEEGRLKDPVAKRLDLSDLPREPSCGAFYQPYSSINALHAIAHIGDLAIDVLGGRIDRSTHRTWVGNLESFSENGLSIMPAWHTKLNARGCNRRFEIIMPRKE